MLFEVADERLAVRLTFGQGAERVEFEADAVDAERLPEAREHDDHFRVDVGTFHAERFGAELIELAVAAALGTFVAEHRPDVPEALRGSVEKIVFVHRAHHGRRAFRTQRELIAVHRVDEGIHFLFDDVGHFPDAAREDLGVLKNRRADFLKTVALEDVDRGFFDLVPDGGVLREHVVHALDARKFFLAHNRLSSCWRDQWEP